MLEGLPSGHSSHFAVEFNFAGLPPGPKTVTSTTSSIAAWASSARGWNCVDAGGLGLVDEWLGIDVRVRKTVAAHAFLDLPHRDGQLIRERVRTGAPVRGGPAPHWLVTADAEGRWVTTLTFSLDTTRAERRGQARVETAISG